MNRRSFIKSVAGAAASVTAAMIPIGCLPSAHSRVTAVDLPIPASKVGMTSSLCGTDAWHNAYRVRRKTTTYPVIHKFGRNPDGDEDGWVSSTVYEKVKPIIDYIREEYAYMKPTFRLYIVKGWRVLMVSIYGGTQEVSLLANVDKVAKVAGREKEYVDGCMTGGVRGSMHLLLWDGAAEKSQAIPVQDTPVR